jgi:hypothetical protein
MFDDAQIGEQRATRLPGVTPHLKWRSIAGCALFLCCASAFADDAMPTVAEAHRFLADLFQRYRVSYTVRYGPGYGDRYKGGVASYAGSECHSELRWAQGSAAGYAVDWSVISSIQISDPLAISFSGQIFRNPQSDGDRYFSSFDLYYPGRQVRQGAFNAFEVLRGSCQRHSRFD